MTKLTNKKYIEQLQKLEQKMLDAEAFAKKIPIFSKEIIEGMFSEDNEWKKISDRYKNIYCAWGINRGKYKKGSGRNITNCKKEYDEYLFNIYINTYSLYDSNDKYGLDEVKDKVPIFFYDNSNSTFYATDEQIEELMEALSEWYENAIVINKHDKDKIKLDKLRREIELLQKGN